MPNINSIQKLAHFLLLCLMTSTMSACASNHNEQVYADKSCEIIRQMAREQFLNRKPNIYGSISDSNESNDILNTLFQSDENKEKSARKKSYAKKC